MSFELWSVILGAILISIALLGSLLRQLPLTAAMFYFAAGIALGPLGAAVMQIDPLGHAKLVERLAEVGVLVSLFTTGLKLRVPLRNPLWRAPVRLAFVSMTLTVALVASLATWSLQLPLGAAILLGAILAPTDPVLASEVQLRKAGDREPVRFSLTVEAGLNDGTAFPFVMLGLGLLGLHEIGTWGWRWLLVDVIWAVAGGLAIGSLLGRAVGHLVLYLRRKHNEGVGYDEFLALGLIGLAYGAALCIHAYGFLAVFAAGLALRTVERRNTGDEKPPEEVLAADTTLDREPATDPEKAPAYMTEAVLSFNEQVERLVEVALVLSVGAMLSPNQFSAGAVCFTPLLLLAIRPVAVVLGLLGSRMELPQQVLVSWFGIRGIGSVYYLMYAVTQGLQAQLAEQLAAVTMIAVATSILVHGISATPLMRLYGARYEREARGKP